MYTHKVSLITHNIGATKMSRINEITFESDEPDYGKAVFALVESDERYSICTPFEPVTLSPITFDVTSKHKSPLGEGRTYDSDRYFLTLADLRKELSNLVKEESFISHGEPFCRTLFSNAGTLNGFYKRNLPDFEVKTVLGSPWLGPSFDQLHEDDPAVFHRIKVGTYHQTVTE